MSQKVDYATVQQAAKAVKQEVFQECYQALIRNLDKKVIFFLLR